MTVRRSIDWKWEEQDGGSGKIGQVIAIKNWKNEPGKGVRVKWFYGNGKPNTYRYGGEGCYDVELYNNYFLVFLFLSFTFSLSLLNIFIFLFYLLF